MIPFKLRTSGFRLRASRRPPNLTQEGENPAVNPRNWNRNRIDMTFAGDYDEDDDEDEDEEEEDDRSLDPLIRNHHDSSSSSKSRYEAYNRLQSAAVAFGEKLPIPEIVALGGQSDGKSSLLEALLGFQFNVREVEMGTCRPLILQMVHDPTALDPRCRFQAFHTHHFAGVKLFYLRFFFPVDFSFCQCSQVVEGPCDSDVVPDGAALCIYQCFENVRNFLVAVEQMGLPTFEASDLEQGGKSSRIVNCILALKSY